METLPKITKNWNEFKLIMPFGGNVISYGWRGLWQSIKFLFKRKINRIELSFCACYKEDSLHVTNVQLISKD
jgi:hypothetical protein